MNLDELLEVLKGSHEVLVKRNPSSRYQRASLLTIGSYKSRVLLNASKVCVTIVNKDIKRGKENG